MPNITIGFGAILTALGLFAYFGAASDNPSMTALIPAFIGIPLIACGVVARQEKLRMHAMHFAAMLGLIGTIAAFGRAVSKLSVIITDDPTVDKRPIRLVLLTGLICIVYVAVCVRSFIVARRRRRAANG